MAQGMLIRKIVIAVICALALGFLYFELVGGNGGRAVNRTDPEGPLWFGIVANVSVAAAGGHAPLMTGPLSKDPGRGADPRSPTREGAAVAAGSDAEAQTSAVCTSRNPCDVTRRDSAVATVGLSAVQHSPMTTSRTTGKAAGWR